MKVIIENSKKIRGCDAIPGNAYRYEDEIVLCFNPCRNHIKFSLDKDGEQTENFAHFIRLNKKDPSSMILDKNDDITPLGEPTIKI